MAMRSWRDLGVVETIYEEDHEASSAASTVLLSLSPSFTSPPPTPLHSLVDSWSLATGRNADVRIHVRGSTFHLHKDPLTRRSRYLKRRLTEESEITLSPPLKITDETFALVATFCYGSEIVMTPFNVAALRTAAELLEMTGSDDGGGGDLGRITEAYFRRAVVVNGECTSIILRSCLELLPEAEAAAGLVGKCIEALSEMDGGDGVVSGLDDVKKMCAEDFQIIVDSMSARFAEGHDLLYGLIDIYLKEQYVKLSEEQRTQICNTVDCNKLSPHFLLHAVQNPRMPLRFVVRAMLVEQLNTRRSFLSAAAGIRPAARGGMLQTKDTPAAVATLGSILEHDATLRQVEQLKTAMNTTCSRIQSLEKDLHAMRKLLQASELTARINALPDSGRSASFRHSASNKIARGERGSASSASLRFRGERVGGHGRSCSKMTSSGEGSNGISAASAATQRSNMAKRLLNGLKSAFRFSKRHGKEGGEDRVESGRMQDGERDGGDDDEDCEIEDIVYLR